MYKKLFQIIAVAFLVSSTLIITPTFAATYSKDLSITSNDIQFPKNVIKGQKIKIYASVKNNSKYDLGV